LDDVAALIFSDPPCSWDTFTTHFRKLFPSEEDLKSIQCLSTLLAIAVMIRLDTSRVECKHAWVRRLLLLKGQSWIPEFGAASADYLIAQSTKLEKKSEDKQAVPTEAAPKKKARRGGGGASRSVVGQFLADNGAAFGNDKAGRMSAAHAAYRQSQQTAGADHDVHVQRGRVGTIAHRVGGRSFDRLPRPAPGPPDDDADPSAAASSSALSLVCSVPDERQLEEDLEVRRSTRTNLSQLAVVLA
jgi:hypothetical protein